MFVCPRCPADQGCFASDELDEVTEHVRVQHLVEEPMEPPCRKCGEPVGNGYDDLCWVCFLNQYAEIPKGEALMPLTTTLICANPDCNRKETYEGSTAGNWSWLEVHSADHPAMGWRVRVELCSLSCLASWAMWRQLEREKAQSQRPRHGVVEYQGSGTFISPLPALLDPPSTEAVR